MELRHIEPLMRDTFINMKFFATSNDFEVVSVLVPPVAMGADADGCRIHCLETGTVAGGLEDAASPRWERYKAYHPAGFKLIHAKLSDFVTFARDENLVPHTPRDVRLEVVDAHGRPVLPGAVFTWQARQTLPLPSRDNIIRVAGDVGLVGFLFGGATWFGRLQGLTQRYMGCDVESLGNVLDWGVGCGRIGRHLLERGFPRLYGADIDQYNIDWLHQHFGWKQAVRVDFDPPMPWADGFFDMIYGHSVFTHLAEPDQDRWLAELARVLRPGGHAFVTTCGEGGVYHSRFRDFANRPGNVEKFLEEGFWDLESQSRYGVDAGRDGYYRLVAHTRAYIMERWSRYFKVRRILPCYIDHQDMVVLERV